jgi:hypothetical protein
LLFLNLGFGTGSQYNRVFDAAFFAFSFDFPAARHADALALAFFGEGKDAGIACVKGGIDTSAISAGSWSRNAQHTSAP